MIELMQEYLTDSDCERISGGNNFECKNCEYSEFAENINYGGCNSEEEFWEQLFE